jgi:NADPH:quinone reductase-like Zn-dependent oxidoreductase
VIDVLEGVDAAVAAGLGIAGLAGWLPFAWRAPLTGGETVLVLGATGSVGLVAVQTAKLLGAARVVAAGRSPAGLERATQVGASATIRLDETDDLEAAFKEAFGGEGPTYVFDPLWGEPAAAAVRAAAPRATVVNLGQSAGATAELASAAVRFKSLSILGHTNFAVPVDELAEHYHRLVTHVAAGDIRFDVERVPLDSVAEAWRRQAEGAGVKLVVVP